MLYNHLNWFSQCNQENVSQNFVSWTLKRSVLLVKTKRWSQNRNDAVTITGQLSQISPSWNESHKHLPHWHSPLPLQFTYRKLIKFLVLNINSKNFCVTTVQTYSFPNSIATFISDTRKFSSPARDISNVNWFLQARERIPDS